MKAWLVRIVALTIFAVSFALPAIRGIGIAARAVPTSTGASPKDQMTGWMCAVFASIVAPKALVQSIGQGIQFEYALIPLSGLINYFFLVILVLSFWRRLVRTRLAIAMLMIPCFAAAWVFFASQTVAPKITPLIGHYLWVAGALLLVAPDVASLFLKQRKAAIAEEESADRTPASR